ncbi:MAG: XdhC family protein [Reyranellaceae bacterium]
MQAALLDKLLKARGERRPVVLATRLEDGQQALVFAETAEGPLAGEEMVVEAARQAMLADRSGVVETGVGKLFLHAHVPAPRLIVVGAVHIAQALVPMAAMAGYAVTVIDPRRAFASDSRFPNVTVLTDWPDEALEALKPDRATAVVTLTHDPKLDDPALIAALNSDCFYVGALGSRRTHEKRLARLAEAGIAPEQMARIHGPVGLDIGALSPAEIAVSIVGQITQVRRRKPEAA